MKMKRKNSVHRLICSVLTCGLIVNSGVIGTFPSNAVLIMDSSSNNDPYNIQAESTSITSLINEAVLQYNSQSHMSEPSAAEYKVLFVKCEYVSIEGVNNNLAFGFSNQKNTILNNAISNFEHTVENFSEGNVNIVTETKTINQIIRLPSSAQYITYDDISTYLNDLAPYGSYDAVLVTSAVPETYLYRGVTSKRMFDAVTGYGYAYVSLVDDSVPSSQYNINEPYLTSTNVMIHEWLHTLESYGQCLRNSSNIAINYPTTHGYLNSDNSIPTASSISSVNALNCFNQSEISDFWFRNDDVRIDSEPVVDWTYDSEPETVIEGTSFAEEIVSDECALAEEMPIMEENIYDSIISEEECYKDISEEKTPSEELMIVEESTHEEITPKEEFDKNVSEEEKSSEELPIVEENTPNDIITEEDNDENISEDLIDVEFVSDNAQINATSTYNSTNFKWQKYYTESDNVVEPVLTSFYRAVLNATVIDKNNNNRQIGMYPKFWKLNSRKMYLGTYIIQNDATARYLYNNNDTLSCGSSLSNSKAYQWNVIYRLESKDISIMSNKTCGLYFDMINASIGSNCLQLYGKTADAYYYAQTFNFIKQSNGKYKIKPVRNIWSDYTMYQSGTNIGFSTNNTNNIWNFINITTLEGEYYIYNQTTNKYLTYNNSVTNKLSLSTYSGASNQKWKIKYDTDQNTDGFFTICPSSNSQLYLNVTNNSDHDNTVISLYPGTGVHSAQTWRTRVTADNQLYIYPNVSTTRSLTYSNSSFVLSTMNENSNQKWQLVKVN